MGYSLGERGILWEILYRGLCFTINIDIISVVITVPNKPEISVLTNTLKRFTSRAAYRSEKLVHLANTIHSNFMLVECKGGRWPCIDPVYRLCLLGKLLINFLNNFSNNDYNLLQSTNLSMSIWPKLSKHTHILYTLKFVCREIESR